MGNSKQILSLGMSYLFGGIILFTAMFSIYSTYQISQQDEQNFSLLMKIGKTEKETAANISSLREELNQLKDSFTLNQQLTNMMSMREQKTEQKLSDLRIDIKEIQKDIEAISPLFNQQINQLKDSLNQSVILLQATEQKLSDLRVDIKGIQKDIEAVSPLISQFNQLKDFLNQSVILLQATKTQGENNDLVHTNNLSNLTKELSDISKTIIQQNIDLTEVKAKLNISGSTSSDLSNIALKSDIETVKTSIQQEIQSVRNSITSHELQTYGPFTALHGNLFMDIDTNAIYPIPTKEPCVIELKKKSLVLLNATGFGHSFAAAHINFLINGKTSLPRISDLNHILFGTGFLYRDYLPIYQSESFVLEPGIYQFSLGVTSEWGSGQIEFNKISFVVSVIS